MGWTLVLKNSKLSAAVGVEPEAACSAGGAAAPSPFAPEYKLLIVAAKNTSSSVALLIPVIQTHPWSHRKTAAFGFTCSHVAGGNRPEGMVEALGRPSRYRVQARARSSSSRLRRRERAPLIRVPSRPPLRESSDSREFRAHARHARSGGFRRLA